MSTSTERILHKAIQYHQKGLLRKADALYRKILLKTPKHAEATHMRGVLKSQEKNHDHAIELLNKASRLSPHDPWVRFHQGELYHSVAQFETAELYFRESLALGANDADVHYMLANTMFDLERFTDAIDSYKAALQLSKNDLECHLNLANSYEAIGQLDQALKHLSFVARHQNNVAIDLQLIALLVRRGEMRQAISCIRQLSDIGLNEFTQLIRLGNQLLAVDRAEAASLLLDHAVTLNSDTLPHHEQELYTGLLINLGRYNDARTVIAATLRNQPVSAITWFQQGLCEQAAGKFEQAAECHRRALKLDDSLSRAAYSLAINGHAVASENELMQWQVRADTVESDSVETDSAEKRVQFLFAIARTHDRRKEYDAAFKAFQEANSLYAAANPFNPDAWDSYINAVILHFSADFFTRVRKMGHGGSNLVFIVGMPRSGSTLLEYQLTARNGAYALGEHPTIRRLFMEMSEMIQQNLTDVECAEHLAVKHIKDMREQYLESLVLHRKHHRQTDAAIDSEKYYVDKMLGNFLRLGIIAAMFPEARILHSVRKAEPTCVSCYTNLFARGLRFTYDLYGLGRAWKSYARLMDHWREVLPLQIYDVSYEKMVMDPDSTFAGISEFLALNVAHDTTNHTAGNKGSDINTASFFQARQPISTSSLHNWQRFESYLEPLYKGLQ